jgi:hypothetical protein
MSFSRPTQPKQYRRSSHTTLNQLAPHASPLNGSCTAPMPERTLGLASGTKRRNPMRQIRYERRIKVAIPPVGPICSVRNAGVCLIKECILGTAVSIPNKEPLDLGDFSRGVSRITAEVGLAERMLQPSILALSSRCYEREGNPRGGELW